MAKQSLEELIDDKFLNSREITVTLSLCELSVLLAAASTVKVRIEPEKSPHLPTLSRAIKKCFDTIRRDAEVFKDHALRLM